MRIKIEGELGTTLWSPWRMDGIKTERRERENNYILKKHLRRGIPISLTHQKECSSTMERWQALSYKRLSLFFLTRKKTLLIQCLSTLREEAKPSLSQERTTLLQWRDDRILLRRGSPTFSHPLEGMPPTTER